MKLLGVILRRLWLLLYASDEIRSYWSSKIQEWYELVSVDSISLDNVQRTDFRGAGVEETTAVWFEDLGDRGGRAHGSGSAVVKVVKF